MAKYISRLLTGVAVFDLVAGLAEGGKGLVLGVVDQDVAVGQVENLGPAVFAGAVPPGRPELPADLESHHGLAGAGRHGEQDALLALEDGLDRPVDGDLLVVAGAFAGEVIEWGEQAALPAFIQTLGSGEAFPQFSRGRETE